LLALLKESLPLCLQSCLTVFKSLILAGCFGLGWYLLSCFRLLNRSYWLWLRGLKLSVELFALHAKNLSKALARVGILFLGKCGTRMDVIEG